jgi:hypothetical protein
MDRIYVSAGGITPPPPDDDVVIYPPPPGAAGSDAFVVTTGGGAQIFVYDAQLFNNSHFAYFDFDGSVDINVQYNPALGSISSAVVRPWSKGITPTINGSTISFTLTEPGHYSIEINGNLDLPLILHANPLEVSPPSPGTPGVIYFGPGNHTPGEITVGSNQTVYIAGGAWVDGVIRGDGVNNATVRGRGILCPTSLHGAVSRGYIGFANSTNITVEGVITFARLRLTYGEQRYDFCDGVTLDNTKLYGEYWNLNGDDGFVIRNSKNISMDNCFARTADDCIAIRFDDNYGTSGATGYYINNCLFWPSVASGLCLTAETQVSSITDFEWTNCDIIHQGSHAPDNDWPWVAAIGIHPSDITTVDGMLIQNVTIEDAQGMALHIVCLDAPFWAINPWSNPGAGGITNIDIIDLHIRGSSGAVYSSVIQGWDGTRQVTNVEFTDLRVDGSVVNNFAAADITVDAPTTSNITIVTT